MDTYLFIIFTHGDKHFIFNQKNGMLYEKIILLFFVVHVVNINLI